MMTNQTQDAHEDPVAAHKLILDQREANERMVAVAIEAQELTDQAESARARAEESEERFRTLFDLAPVGVYSCDRAGVIQRFNQHAAELWGRQPEVGDTDERFCGSFKMFRPDGSVMPHEQSPMAQVVDGRVSKVVDAEVLIERSDGSRVTVVVNIRPLKNRRGEVTGAINCFYDITERKRTESEIADSLSRQAEQRFRLLVDSVRDYAIFILDTDGHVATWNQGAERIKGYKRDEIIGKHFSIFYPPDDVAAGKTQRELEITIREGRFEEEGWRVRKDGSRFRANVTITALHGPDGALVGFAKVTRDLTDREEAEETRRALAVGKAALAEKARIQEFQERFIAILGHDLRNPLASIDYGAGFLQKRSTDPATRRTIDRMRTSSLRMSRMIEQILDLTRTRLGGGLDLKRRRLDIADTLTRIVDELRGIHPSMTLDLRCTALEGEWDEDRIEQVFSNIIGNAIVYGEPSKPISVEGRREGGLASIVVHNYGKPIPEDLQPILFNPFRRGERDSRSAKTEGLGLGLYISNEVVKAHGGRIEVQSNLADGTTFRVILPLNSDGESS
jgi:PAS domain S-box-containing protein